MRPIKVIFFLLVAGSAAPAQALPRLVLGDLHGQADLKEVAVGASVLAASALARSGRVEIVSRTEVIDIFNKLHIAQRDGLWIGPAEAGAVCKAVSCTQLITGTIKSDASQIHIVLRLLQHDGTLVKPVKITHPIRTMALLPQIVADKMRELLGIAATPPPAARPATMAALGSAWIFAQRNELELAVAKLELATRPVPVGSGSPVAQAFDPQEVVRFAREAGDITAIIGTEGPLIKLRAQLAISPREAEKGIEKFTDENPADVGARFLYARALIDMGKAREAMTVLRPREGEDEIAEAHLLRGRALLLLKDNAKAKQELERALALDGHNLETHYAMGETLTRLHDPKGAEHFELAARGFREHGDARFADAFLRGVSLDTRMATVFSDVEAREFLPREAAASGKTLATAVKGKTGDANASYCRGVAAFGAGDLPGASQALGEAQKLAPKDYAINRVLARVASEQGNHKLAAECLATAYEAKPTPRLALDAALEARAAGKIAAARDFYAKAAADSTLAPLASRELGELALTSGDAQAAIDKLKAAAANEPDDADIHIQLAEALTLTGDADGARAEKLAASALDPDVTVERGGIELKLQGEAKGPTQVAGAALADEPAAELIAQLPTLLRRFPALRERAAEGGPSGGAIVVVHDPVAFGAHLLPFRPVRHELIERAFDRLLRGPFDFSRVVIHRETLSADALLKLAEHEGASLVLQYQATAKGRKISLDVLLTDARGKAFRASAEMPAPSVIGVATFVPTELAVGLLAALVLWVLLRPRGELLIKIAYDEKTANGLFSLQLSRLRKSNLALEGGNEQAFVEAVRRKGSHVSARSATMVGRETLFRRLPAGNWWVYLFGVFVQDKRTIGNFLSEKQVRVTRDQQLVVDFNLIPDETSVTIRVKRNGKAVYGAMVWLNGDEHKGVYTNKMADGVLLMAPRGEHVVHARAEGKLVKSELCVRTHEPMTLTLDLEALAAVDAGSIAPAPATAAPARAASDKAGAAGENQPQTMMPGNFYDLEHAPPATAMAGRAHGSGPVSIPAVPTPAPFVPSSGRPLTPAASDSIAKANAVRYKLGRELGRGAMGIVYEAWDTVLERAVALKVISQDLRNRPDVIELFMREARSLAALNHPNIVTVFDFGQRSDDYFMALEMVEGRTLEAVLATKGGSLPAWEAVEIVLQVCTALGYAHNQRVIHRDVKPSNIFLLPDQRVKIMDFGLARVVRELQIKNTMIAGTPLYMSPEQIRGTDVDFRADLYSLGCMFYEMLCGTPPFYEGEILYHHMNTAPEAPTRRMAGLPAALDAVVLRCLEKDKDKRYPSVHSFAQALRELKASLGGQQSASAR